MNNLRYKIIFLWGGFILGLTAFPLMALGADATMSIAPPVGTFHVYEDVTLRILLSSDGQEVKAVGARLTYNPDELTVTHVITEGSLISSWVQIPIVDAVVGEISFEGWFATSTILEKQTILTIRVRPEVVGEVVMRFESGSTIVASNGAGSNILTGFSSGKFRIKPEELNIAEVEVDGGGSGAATSPSLGEVLGLATVTPSLILTSKTHPDQDAWYSASSSVFEIQYPVEAEAIYLGYDKRASGLPSVRYAPPIREKIIASLEDGVSYFHASVDTDKGFEVAHYRLQVDRRKPTDVTFVELQRADIADPNCTFLVGAKDFPSGIATYSFSVNDGPEDVWRDDGTHRYKFRAQAQGVHKIAMTVFDKAGNSVKKELTFEVGYLPEPALMLFGDAPKEGNNQSIKVMATPNAEVSIVTTFNGGELLTEKLRTNSSGSVIFVSSVPLALGEYKVWATTFDDRGAVSRQSNEIIFTPEPSFLGMISRHPGVLIAIVVALLLFFFLRRVLSGLREELNAESNERRDQVATGGALRVGGTDQVVLETIPSSQGQVVLRKRE